MKHSPDIAGALRVELSDWRRWITRAVVLSSAILAGLTVVVFSWLSDQAFLTFQFLHSHYGAWVLLWTPLCTAAVVWMTRRYAPGAAGSGIPQVMAALHAGVNPPSVPLFVSLRLTIGKIFLTAAGLLGGLSLGREGPSVQIAAGIMHHARRWLPRHSGVSAHGLLVAGGAAGIAAAFNTPLGGIMFAIEELSRRPEQRNSGLLMAGIIFAGLVAVSFQGNATYFGVIHVAPVGWPLLLPACLLALASGLAGGLFSRVLIASLSGRSRDAFTRLRHRRPVAFAALCGLLVMVIGLVTQGGTFGSGYQHTRDLLQGAPSSSVLFVPLKFVATWLTTWAGVPAGIFAPSLAIGAGMGHDLAQLMHFADQPTLIALGMVGFLAAVTQAPLTSFIIVMEMVDGHALVLSLMACALVASVVSRWVSAPLYATLAELQLLRLPQNEQDASRNDTSGHGAAPPHAPSH